MADRDIEIWKLIFQGVQTIGIVGGAIWAAWRFKRERTHAPQIEFTVDANLHGPSEGTYAAEYILTFNNKGKTRVQVSRIELRVRGIKSGKHLQDWPEHGKRLLFPDLLVYDDKVIPKDYGYTFFEPGIKQEYRYLSKVPVEYKFILIRAQFLYTAGNPHSAERVIAVHTPENRDQSGTSEVSTST